MLSTFKRFLCVLFCNKVKMRSLPILLLFGFFAVLIQSRPSQMDDNVESNFEADYGAEDKPASDDSSDGDSKLNDDASGHDEHMNQNGRMVGNNNLYTYEQQNVAESRADRTNSDISDYRLKEEYGNRNVRNDKAEKTNTNYDDIENYAKRRQTKYIENKDAADQQESAQHLTNRNVNNNYYKNNRIHNNILLEEPLSKREVAWKPLSEQGEMLFGDREQASQTVRNDFNNVPLETNQRHSKYYTQMHPENKELLQCKNSEGQNHLDFNRDRRETKDSNVDTVSKIDAGKESVKNQNEDEETAIRRHIKKLSSDELEELLSSLSEDKRQLLKTIIDDADQTVNINDNLIKREITKKAEAVEENACVESAQADSSNIQGESSAVVASTEASGQSTEANKQTNSENMNLSNPKSTERSSGNKAGLFNQADDAVQQKSDASEVGPEKTPAQIVPSEQVTIKNENKRETNLDDLSDIVSFEDSKMMDEDWLTGDSKDQQGYFCSQDEDLSQFLDDDQGIADDGSKIYKRDVNKQADYDAKMKSLEESFPKSPNYDESAGPLIRVKRKNEPAMRKRSAAILPDAKVAFFPYRAENDDEDNDEGNEFDDDGFYDRTPNLSSDEANKPSIRDASSCKLNDIDRRASSKDVSKGTVNLGSDTDSVLSGVEGVDENLMFSSGSRNRRTTEDISDVIDETNSIHNSKSLIDETKAVSDMNALTYQESDSFGPLPRNNEGESGRYKRIRRVKQSHPEGSSTDS